MSRRLTGHPFALDDAAWLAGRIFPQQTAIFYHGTEADDRLLGSNFDDYFDMSQGGDDVVQARGGEDVIYFGAAFTGADRVDGGFEDTSTDIVILDGDYSAGIHIAKQSLQNIDLLGLNGGSFVITGILNFNDGNRTIVDATSLIVDQSLNIQVSSTRSLDILAGDGDDILHGAMNHRQSELSGGAGDDVLIGEGGRTLFQGGLGADHVVMAFKKDSATYQKADSSADSYDVIDGFKAHIDGGSNRIYLKFDSDEIKPGYQKDFHVTSTSDGVSDIVTHYDAELNHTVVDVFTNGDDVPDFVLHLMGDVTLTISDFAF